MTQENIQPTDENESVEESTTADVGGELSKRGRSSISFPYIDFSKAVVVAEAIHGHVGTGPCSPEQLAAWIDQSPKSSSFRYQVNVARMFGLLEAGEPLKLADLGRMLVDPKRAQEARAKAFLKVPLFNALYEKFKADVLPPTAALQVEMIALGVADKQKALARQVFERSAEQTGYFEHGRERLVMPGFAPTTDAAPKSDATKLGGNGGGGDGDTALRLDPLLMALLQKVPSKEEGWAAAKRVRWFRTFAMNVSQIYDDDDKPPVELKIDVAKEGE